MEKCWTQAEAAEMEGRNLCCQQAAIVMVVGILLGYMYCCQYQCYYYYRQSNLQQAEKFDMTQWAAKFDMVHCAVVVDSVDLADFDNHYQRVVCFGKHQESENSGTHLKAGKIQVDLIDILQIVMSSKKIAEVEWSTAGFDFVRRMKDYYKTQQVVK